MSSPESAPRPARIGFVGLGVMGFPMAGHLQSAGYEVIVFNRTTSAAQRWIDEHGGQRAESPRGAAEAADMVMTIVGNDDDVRDVVLGDDGVLAGLAAARQSDSAFGPPILVDHTTASAGLARELAETGTAMGVGVIDAPVSGGQAGAENGRLTVMCGGDPAIFDRARPTLETYAVAVTRLGDAGAGQLTKMVNQLCIAGLLQGLAEGIHLGKLAGLDIDQVVDVISRGAAGSWQMENRGSTMAQGEFDFGFAVDWMRKDLGIALEEGRARGASLPVAALVDQFYAQLQSRGGGRWDTSALIDLLDRP